PPAAGTRDSGVPPIGGAPLCGVSPGPTGTCVGVLVGVDECGVVGSATPRGAGVSGICGATGAFVSVSDGGIAGPFEPCIAAVGKSSSLSSLSVTFDTFSPIDDTSDRKSTRLNSSHDQISYAVFCLK